MENYSIKLTAAVVFNGKVHRAGTVLDLPKKQAENILNRGKGLPNGAAKNAQPVEKQTEKQIRKAADDAGIKDANKKTKSEIVEDLKKSED